MKHCTCFNLNTYIYTELSVTVSSAEAAGQTDGEPTLDRSVCPDAESLPVKEQLSPMVPELGKLSHQSDDELRYSEFCTKHKYTVMCFIVS